jgi:hypothetical protein
VTETDRVDRSVTYGVDATHPDDPAVIRLRPAPDADPILIVTLDARHVETVLQAARLLRPTLEWADEVNRADRLISTCERALRIYHDWIEERERAAAAAVAPAPSAARSSTAGKGASATENAGFSERAPE